MLADADARCRPAARALTVPSARLDRDDLRRAEIFGAEDRAAQRRCVVEADVLGPDAERPARLGATSSRSSGTATSAPSSDDLVGALLEAAARTAGSSSAASR